jgi:hypothetical protein
MLANVHFILQAFAKQLIGKATTKDSSSFAHTMLANVHFFSCPDALPQHHRSNPAKAAAYNARNVVLWCLHIPATQQMDFWCRSSPSS